MYISKTDWAHDASESDWHCDRAGSDTCIIPHDELIEGDIIYTVIMCHEACTFDLRSYYVTEYSLDDGE